MILSSLKKVTFLYGINFREHLNSLNITTMIVVCWRCSYTAHAPRLLVLWFDAGTAGPGRTAADTVNTLYGSCRIIMMIIIPLSQNTSH
jgi:hypothetical protein